jgi:hypothetical protein
LAKLGNSRGVSLVEPLLEPGREVDSAESDELELPLKDSDCGWLSDEEKAAVVIDVAVEIEGSLIFIDGLSVED